MRVRRQRDLRLFHGEDDRLLLLDLRDERQKRKDEHVDGAGAQPLER